MWIDDHSIPRFPVQGSTHEQCTAKKFVAAIMWRWKIENKVKLSPSTARLFTCPTELLGLERVIGEEETRYRLHLQPACCHASSLSKTMLKKKLTSDDSTSSLSAALHNSHSAWCGQQFKKITVKWFCICKYKDLMLLFQKCLLPLAHHSVKHNKRHFALKKQTLKIRICHRQFIWSSWKKSYVGKMVNDFVKCLWKSTGRGLCLSERKFSSGASLLPKSQAESLSDWQRITLLTAM